jgi:glycosyltransferase involved in cell wall biosynthesis
MNIWYLSAHDQPKGISSRTYDFSQELVKRGHRVTMFTNSYCHFTHVERLSHHEKWRIEEIDGIRVVWLHTFPYIGNGWRRGVNMLSNAWRALQVARALSDKPDVVIGPSVPLGTGWAASRIAGMKGAAFVFEVRDVWPIALVDDGGLSKRSPVYYSFRLLEKYLYRKSQRISATMPFIYQHVSESGSNPEKVTWIPNGVNFERYSGLDTYDGGENLPLVAMYVGGFGNAHDVITIVRAARIFQQNGNDKYRFVLIGDGVKRSECRHEASLHALSNIEFRDPIPKSEVPRVQMEADILIAAVLDSAAYRFGLNLNKMFDYLASGRPVIFSGNAPNDPVAESGAGFSIPPEDPEAMAGALQKLLDMSPAERIELGKRGRRYVENAFDIKKLTEHMEVLLLQAINDKEKMNAA